MLHRPMSRVLIAGAAFVSLATLAGPTSADTIYETVYLPTSSSISLPTSRVLSTSYVLPTSYVSSSYVPTSYVSSSILPTSYVSSSYVPTSYVTTSYLPTSSVVSYDSFVVPTSTTYYRRSLFRPRRYVERTSYSYLPTSYLMPTSYYLPTSYVVPTTSVVSRTISPTTYLIDTGLVQTSLPCETESAPMPTRSTVTRAPSGSNTGNGNTLTSEPTNGGGSNERKPSATVNPADDPVPSNVEPPVTMPSTGPATPPTPPVPEKPKDTGPVMPKPGEAGATPPNTNETVYRVRRPSYDTRNILRGRVISAESNLPEEGITVIASSVTKSFTDRVAMSDADGGFKLSLPNGDWTVKVKMASGSVYTVSRDYLTASGGKVSESSGRNVGELLISR